MLFFVRYQGKEHRVRVESRRNQLFVSYESEPEEAIDLFFFGNDVTYFKDNRVFSANVVGHKTEYAVWRPEGNFNLTVESEYRRIVSLLRGQALDQENNVYAKMPGKITKLLIKVGDEIAAGDPVLVMEAMKMENEVRANVAGRIKAISIKEGQAVETGTLLVELVPTEP